MSAALFDIFEMPANAAAGKGYIFVVRTWEHKMRIFKFSPIVLALFLLPVVAPAQPGRAVPAEYDIMGIRLGMPLDDAEAQLKAQEANVQIIPIRNASPLGGTSVQAIHAFNGAVDPDNHKFKLSEDLLIQVTQSLPQRVLLISRNVYLTDATAPTTDKLVEALSKKYGSFYTKLVGGGFPLEWIFDAKGRPINQQGEVLGPDGRFRGKPGPVSSNTCTLFHSAQPFIPRFPASLGPSPVAYTLEYYIGFTPQCGVSLVVSAPSDKVKNGIVTYFSETLADDQLAIADSNAIADQLKRIANQQHTRASAEPAPKL